MKNTQTREGYEWWDKFCSLPHYSFLLDEHNAVRRVQDKCGAWVNRQEAGEVVGHMQDEINNLKAENLALQQRLQLKAV